MNDRITHLRVKVKTLAAEARIIRLEERRALARAKTERYVELHIHRVGIVRSVARLNLLAYGYLRGVPYKAMEARCATAPDWKAIGQIIARFGGSVEGFAEWTGEKIAA